MKQFQKIIFLSFLLLFNTLFKFNMWDIFLSLYMDESYEPTTQNFIKAALEDNLNKIRRFLTIGLDPNCHVGDFVTALHIAADHNYFGLLRILTEHSRTKVNVQDDGGNTALHLATVRNHENIILHLIRCNADINIPNKNENYPLHTAVKFKYSSIVKLFLEQGAEVDKENIFGETPLYLAVIRNPSHKNLDLLIRYGANMNRNNGKTMPIIIDGALECNNLKFLDILEFFMDKGCDVNIKDKRTGRTAMHMVALTGYYPMAQALINYGAVRNIRDKLKKTPMDVAYLHNNTVMIAFFSYIDMKENTEDET